MSRHFLIRNRLFPRLMRAAFLLCLVWLPAGRAGATTVIPPDFATLVGTATRVVQATVIGSESAWVVQGGYRVIKTWVTLSVSEQLKGDSPSASLRLEFLGGRVGEDEMRVESSPRFNVGDEVILFVANNGVDACPLVGWGHGAYAVRTDVASGEKRVHRINGAPLASTSDVALPLGGTTHPAIAAANLSRPALTPADFKAAIRDAQKQGNHEN